MAQIGIEAPARRAGRPSAPASCLALDRDDADDGAPAPLAYDVIVVPPADFALGTLYSKWRSGEIVAPCSACGNFTRG